MERATVYNWEQVKDSDSETEKKYAVKSLYKPESVDYARHESATQHTHKRRLPWKKLLVLAAAASVVVVSVGFVVRHITSGAGIAGPKAAVGGIERLRDPARGSGGGSAWLEKTRSPRAGFESRPEAAPLYDDLQVVKSQPRVSGCMSLGVAVGGKPECYCTTAQGNVIPEISVHACRTLVKLGWWDETKKPVDTGQEQRDRLNALSGDHGGKPPGTGATQSTGPAAPVLTDQSDGA